MVYDNVLHVHVWLGVPPLSGGCVQSVDFTHSYNKEVYAMSARLTLYPSWRRE